MKNNFGYNGIFLKDTLKELNMNVSEFARFCNLKRPVISRMCSGTYRVMQSQFTFSKVVDGLSRLGVDNAEIFLNPNEEIKKININEETNIMTSDVLTFFNLINDPFESGIPQSVWLNSENELCLEQIKNAAKRGKFLLIIGPVGSGKSTLFSKAWKHLREMPGFKLSRIPNLNVKRTDDRWITNYFITKIAGINKLPYGIDERANLLNDVLENLKAESVTPVLFFDEAHQIPEQTLRDIRIFWEDYRIEDIKISFILFAQPLIRGLLSKPNLKEVVRRIEILELKSFDRINNTQDIHSYINFKLQDAGLEKSPFEEKAINLIAKECKNPLEVNIVARKAMINAWEISSKVVTVACVEQALRR